MRPTSLVVFDVRAECSDEEVTKIAELLFAKSPAVSLRVRSPLTYQSGDYERGNRDPDVWTGRLERIRNDPISSVIRDEGGFHRFVDVEAQVSTSYSTTFFAFVPQARLLVYQDTAEMPFTRMASYVTSALQDMREGGFRGDLELVPRMIERPFREWLEHFTAVDRVRVKYQHSNSPGNRAIDSIIEQLRAETITETVRAREKEELNKQSLLSTDLPIGRALNHLELSPRNGDAEISGRVGDTRVRFNTKSPVERHMIEIEEDVASMRSALGHFAMKLMSLGSRK